MLEQLTDFSRVALFLDYKQNGSNGGLGCIRGDVCLSRDLVDEALNASSHVLGSFVHFGDHNTAS